MEVYSAQRIRALLDIRDLVDALADAFRAGYVAPQRLVAPVPGGAGDRTLLAMPAFEPSGAAAIKLTLLFPDNPARGLPTNQAAVVVFSATGTPVAIMDGAAITHLRTSATSALASRYLSRPDSRRLLVIGAGALAPYMALAHCAVRPIEEVRVWARRPEQAALVVERVREALDRDIDVDVCGELAASASQADIVSCATSAVEPLLAGRWLQPGAFVDLVGSFRPHARECDDDTVTRARLFVDTFDAALEEAGDLLEPLRRGVITRATIEGQLADLVAGRVEGRRSATEITLFKSVGTAIEDLAAAKLILARAEVDVPRADGSAT